MSCQRTRSNQRLDLLAATAHDRYTAADYQRLRAQGIHTARDGVRWHLIERRAGFYDFSSLLPMVRAARQTGIQVVWDLCHYGWPDNLDIFSSAFVERFARFAAACARLLLAESDSAPLVVPINEISFLAWAGGDSAYLNPFARGRSYELKMQLVRAAIAAIEAVWQVSPAIRIVHTEPLIHVVAAPDRPHDHAAAEGFRLAQYQAWDMLSGRLFPELGGDEKYLDLLGVNYYPNNQWFLDGPWIERHDPLYRPFHHLLEETYRRYGRPLFIGETSDEERGRADWLRYVCEEVRLAQAAGVPVEGICLYPILDYPDWYDGRLRRRGLWGAADDNGKRELYRPLAEELQRQMTLMQAAQPAGRPTRSFSMKRTDNNTHASSRGIERFDRLS
jgi:beta-glucosidase/6-phospho-beta-glucosidase/beta-galactosidase